MVRNQGAARDGGAAPGICRIRLIKQRLPHRVGEARERIGKPAFGSKKGRDQVFWPIRQGIQIAPVLDLRGDPVVAGGPFNRSAQVGHQEVVEGPLPATHPGADRLLLDVLA
jgi:hypothetical protein